MSLLGQTVDNQGRTIMRIVGDIWVQAQGTDGFSGGSIGIYVDTEEARAAGATMEPRSDSAPWMLLRQFNMQRQTATDANPFFHILLDVRARRRLAAQSVLMCVFESGGMPAAANIELQGRVLLAQP